MKMEVQISFQVRVFISFDSIPKSGVVEPYDCSVFDLQGISILFSKITAPIYTPAPSNTQGFHFLHMLAHTFLIILIIGILQMWGHCGLIHISLMTTDVVSISSCICWPYACILLSSLYHICIICSDVIYLIPDFYNMHLLFFPDQNIEFYQHYWYSQEASFEFHWFLCYFVL